MVVAIEDILMIPILSSVSSVPEAVSVSLVAAEVSLILFSSSLAADAIDEILRENPSLLLSPSLDFSDANDEILILLPFS